MCIRDRYSGKQFLVCGFFFFCLYSLSLRADALWPWYNSRSTTPETNQASNNHVQWRTTWWRGRCVCAIVTYLSPCTSTCPIYFPFLSASGAVWQSWSWEPLWLWVANETTAVSYTHLDVYKRQELCENVTERTYASHEHTRGPTPRWTGKDGEEHIFCSSPLLSRRM